MIRTIRQVSAGTLVRVPIYVVLFVLVEPLTLLAAELQLVVPPGYEHLEGNAIVGNSGVNTPFRAQFLHLASEFVGLPPGGAWLVGSNVRLDGSVTTPRTVSYANAIFRVSTTSRNTLSTVFADNIGPDETVVSAGLASTFYPADGPPGGPRGFGISERFQTPFFYDPSKGNLLFDFSSTSGFDVANPLDAVVAPTVRSVFNLDPASPTATYSERWALVRELAFVPEPSSFVMAATAAWWLGVRRRRASRLVLSGEM